MGRGLVFLLVVMVILSGGCANKPRTLLLATTTSTQDSGLLDEILPLFERKYGLMVKTIAVGTGEALALGQKGNVDLVLVHAPGEEKRFLAQGYGVLRRRIMHNYFVILGPSRDPAHIRDLDPSQAFKRIYETKSLFISRGDNSGTHQKERDIWEKAGLRPKGDWYLETGLGMGETLRVSAEKQGYTLSDKGTYLAQKKGLNLVSLIKEDQNLINPYSVMAVNPEKFSRVNYGGAKKFIAWLTSEEVQRRIAKFGEREYGEPLFMPDAQ